MTFSEQWGILVSDGTTLVLWPHAVVPVCFWQFILEGFNVASLLKPVPCNIWVGSNVDGNMPTHKTDID